MRLFEIELGRAEIDGGLIYDIEKGRIEGPRNGSDQTGISLKALNQIKLAKLSGAKIRARHEKLLGVQYAIRKSSKNKAPDNSGV